MLSRWGASVVLAMSVLASWGGVAPAAAQYMGGGTKTVHEARVADLETMRDKFIALGKAFPAESYEWRPMEGVRSVHDVLALIAAETVLFPTMWGFEAPAWAPDPRVGPELERLGGLAPEELVTEIERGFGHLLELVRGLDAEARDRHVDFFGLEVPLGAAVTLMANDMHEHLGQLIAYARTNRIVPPWSREEGT